MDERSRPQVEVVAQAEAEWRGRSAASAANYERSGVPTIFRPWAERLLAAAGFESVQVDSIADEHRTTAERLMQRVVTPEMDEPTRAAVRRDVVAALAPWRERELWMWRKASPQRERLS